MLRKLLGTGLVVTAGFVFASLGLCVAQYPPTSMYQQGTIWQRAANGCASIGRQPDGSTVYAWQSACNGTADVWGYAFSNPNQLDVAIWPAYLPACGTTVARAWQWYDNGSWAEYIGTRDPNSCAPDYYSNSWGGGCPATIGGLYQRYLNTYRNFIAAPPNSLAQEVAWHAYNRAYLTFSVCQRQAVAAGPGDYHDSR
jgi:hypothetical protein